MGGESGANARRAHLLSRALGIALVLTSCSSVEPRERVRKELESAASWSATARMIGQMWLRDAVPTVYARRALASTMQSLRQSEERITREAVPVAARDSITAALAPVEAGVDAMRAAVEKGDRAAVQARLRELDAAGERLKAMSGSAAS
ncbi:MAG TPA: hypothetical protein VFS05_13610 [Gemmatimonadaceae bacterium]|nr:hypothetical protein [Gemmatimonadaceae bacterium]